MEKLIEEAKKGNKQAFENLILSYEKDLYRIAKLRLDNIDDVYDVIQETTMIAFKSIKKLKYNQYFKTWLIKILMNESNKIYNQRHKNPIISFEQIEDYKETTVSNIEDIEKIIDFDFLCRNLKYEDKVIIILYYMERFTDKEIAQILKLKEKTVTTKRTRIKQKIKNNIETGGKELWMN